MNVIFDVTSVSTAQYWLIGPKAFRCQDVRKPISGVNAKHWGMQAFDWQHTGKYLNGCMIAVWATFELKLSRHTGELCRFFFLWRIQSSCCSIKLCNVLVRVSKQGNHLGYKKLFFIEYQPDYVGLQQQEVKCNHQCNNATHKVKWSKRQRSNNIKCSNFWLPLSLMQRDHFINCWMLHYAQQFSLKRHHKRTTRWKRILKLGRLEN